MMTQSIPVPPRGVLVPGALFLLAAFAPMAAAQKGRIEVNGAVNTNSITSGPFAGLPAGTPVTLRMDVTVPGFEVQPDHYELYPIDTTTSFLKAGDATITFKSVGGPVVGLQDAYPVADGVHLELKPMSPTYSMECEMWDGTGGHIWDSTDYELNAGFYGPELFLDIAWNVFGGGGAMNITMDHFVIHPVSSAGTWLLDTQGVAAPGASAPVLTAEGAIAAGQPLSMRLAGAAPAAPIITVVGLSALRVPFKGGTLVPQPDLLILDLATDATGAAAVSGLWPAAMPAGMELYFQMWIPDALAPMGLAASNGLHAIGA